MPFLSLVVPLLLLLPGPSDASPARQAAADPVTVRFSVETDDPRVGTPVVFEASSDAAIERFVWDFDGDGRADASGKRARHTFRKAGARTVTLTAVDGNGEEAACSRAVPVRKASGARAFFLNEGRWPDASGTHINAHGGGVTYHDEHYYWFGEHKSARTNSAQVGVQVYRSADLYHWTNEGVALAVSRDPESPIVRGATIERPKVIYNEATDTFVMWFHLELKGQGYEAALTGVATADRIAGPYVFQRALRPNAGAWPIDFPDAYRSGPTPEAVGEWFTDRWWQAFKEGLFVRRDFEGGQMSRDMNLFVDDDGTAYHIHSSEQNRTLHISELTEDYTGFTGRYARVLVAEANEAPAVWKHDGKYWMIASGLSGWAPNAARSAVAESILGPWTMLGNPARGTNPHNGLGPEKTFGGQSTDVFPLQGQDGAFIAMFDQWRPDHPIDGRYLWLPITFDDGRPIVRYRAVWDRSLFDPQTPER